MDDGLREQGYPGHEDTGYQGNEAEAEKKVATVATAGPEPKPR